MRCAGSSEPIRALRLSFCFQPIVNRDAPHERSIREFNFDVTLGLLDLDQTADYFGNPHVAFCAALRSIGIWPAGASSASSFANPASPGRPMEARRLTAILPQKQLQHKVQQFSLPAGEALVPTVYGVCRNGAVELAA
jgi:hypothetical protein